MRVNRVELHNYMGIVAVAYDFPASGGVIAGESDTGKTTVLRAIKEVLEGRGLSADAIRNGASESEILIDLDALSIRQVIGEKNPAIQVIKDGVRQKSPRKVLQELLGVAMLDPLELLNERDPAKRKALVLAALPVRVTMGMIRRWLPEASADDIRLATGMLPNGGEEEEVPGHGLDVVKRLREHFYEKRTEANRAAKARFNDVGESEKVLTDARQKAERYADVQPMDKEDANAQLVRVEGLLDDMTRKRREAEESVGRNRRAVARANELRGEASRIRAAAPLGVTEDEFDVAEGAVFDAKAAERMAFAEVERLRALLEQATARHTMADNALSDANNELTRLRNRHDAAEVAVQQAATVEMQAAEIEALAGIIAGPTDQDIEDARAAANAAQKVVDRITVDDVVELADQRLTAARKAHNDADFEARKLDKVVRFLTDEAPGQLLSNVGLEGVTVDGDSILVNGVSLDRLSGARSMEFAVRVAKLLNAKTKILIVDALEKLDDKRRAEFIRLATADGFQLIGTRVASGAPHLEPIAGGAQ